MRVSKFTPSLALTAVMLTVGCVAPQLTPKTTSPSGPIGFFDQVNGSAAIDIRLIDKRQSTQAFADADAFNGVLFDVRNTAKLKAPRRVAVGAANGDYQTVFTNLPSDAAANYTLTAGLFRNVTDPTSTADAAYANLDHKVGEGGSVTFSLQPGERKTITIVINAVGEVSFDSDNTVIDAVTPTFVASDSTAVGLTELSTLTNPAVTALKYAIVGMDEATASTGTILPANWQTPPANTELGFMAPGDAGNYKLVVDMLKGSDVVSRRSRVFTVEAPATIDASFTDPTPTPTPAPNFDYTATVGGTAGAFTVNGLPSSQFSFSSFMMPPMFGGVLKVVNTTASTLVVDDNNSASVMTVAPGETKYFNMTSISMSDFIMPGMFHYTGGVTFSVPQG